VQRAYLQGLEDDGTLSFSEGESEGEMPEGTVHRANVDAGTDVIDLAGMRAELEAARRDRQGGG
jgi:hypothetical protein